MSYLPELIAFVSGAVVMILELDGSRIIAPYLGTSTIVWTGLIGVILGSLSFGYWWGGKLADKEANFKTLGKVLAAAALSVLAIAYLKNLLELTTLFPHHLIVTTLVGTTILFAPATLFLGIVTPYVARLKMKTVENSGRTVGTLYALSTLGSIIGTFLGGFVLISYFGSTQILLLLSATLFVLAAGACGTHTPKEKVLVFLCLLLGLLVLLLKPSSGLSANVIRDIDTEYSRVWILDDRDAATGRAVRYMTNTMYGIQSGSFLDTPDELLFPYTKLFDLAATLYPDFDRALMIGAGAYSYPKHFTRIYKNASLDVVEIDPALTELAAQYFGLTENPRVAIINEDGRTFLNRNKKRYDVIWNDAFLSHLNIPFQLTTHEAIQKMYDSLDENGIVMTNIISAITGPKSTFLQAEYATYKKIFPAVYLIQVNDRPETEGQNIMLVALKSPEADMQLTQTPTTLGGVRVKKVFTLESDPSVPALTDEFAPIEKYIAQMLL